MDRKALAYSGILLLSLVFVALLLNKGVVQAVLNEGDAVLETPSEPNALGEPREFDLTLLYPDFEMATLSGAKLKITRTADSVVVADVLLPLEFDTSTVSTTVAIDPNDANTLQLEGDMEVTYTFVDVIPYLTTTPSNSTLPGGGTFKGIAEGARIEFHIHWTSPNDPLDPAYIGGYSAVVDLFLTERTDLGNIIPSNTVNFDIGARLSIVVGLNMITFPVDVGAMTTKEFSGEIAGQGGDVAQVIKWDAASQSYVLWSAASPGANVFDMVPGRGYFVLAVAEPAGGNWIAVGQPFPAPVSTDFVTGLNMVGVPATTNEGYDTASLAGAIDAQGGDIAQVIKWDAASQSYVLWSAASPGANVFAIDNVDGIFVLATQPSTFVP